MWASGGQNWHSFRDTGKRCVNGAHCKDPRGKQCLLYHREACKSDGSFQTNATMVQYTLEFPKKFPLPFPKQDVASFLLVRGPYSWLGYSWAGCHTGSDYSFLRPAEVEVDYGEPVDPHCREAGRNSGIFT